MPTAERNCISRTPGMGPGAGASPGVIAEVEEDLLPIASAPTVELPAGVEKIKSLLRQSRAQSRRR